MNRKKKKIGCHYLTVYVVYTILAIATSRAELILKSLRSCGVQTFPSVLLWLLSASICMQIPTAECWSTLNGL